MERFARSSYFPATLNPIRLQVTLQAVRRYAEISRDFNPIHLDQAFAAATPMEGVIAHGTMSLNLIWQSVTATFGANAAWGAKLNVRFIRPVHIEDEVCVGSAHHRDAPGTYDVWIAKASGVRVIDGQLSLPSAHPPDPDSSIRKP